MAIPVSYNLRNVIRRPVSTAMTAIGIGLTVAIFIGALSLAAGFEQAVKTSGSPDNILVTRKGADAELSSAVSREAANIVRAHPSVAAGSDNRPLASPEVVVLIVLDRLGQPGSSNVTIRGVDREALALRDNLKVVEGRMFEPGRSEVIAGRRLAGRFQGIDVGGTVKFGAHEFTIVGLFEAGGSNFESEIWGDNKVIMPAARGEVFQSVTFRLAPGANFHDVKHELEADPRLQVDVERESEYYAKQSEMLANIVRFLGVFITVIMGVGAVFGAMNTMYAAVGQRTREIATMLVLGFSPFIILVSFLIESVVVALIGGAFGALLSLPINGISTGTTNFQSFSETAFEFRVTPGAIVTGLVAAAIMGFVGGLLPSIRAARHTPAQALRG
ncbi:ABC transporter permease [bacterium]|nr:ABC transporter permease [bacterium]